jgi:hypothetical protein
MTNRQGALPKFWRRAIEALRELGVKPTDPRRTTQDDARAHPLWFSEQVRLAVHPLDKYFREDLKLRTVRDVMNPQAGDPYTADEILPWIKGAYRQEGEYYKVARGQYVREQDFKRRWNAYIAAIPTHLIWLAGGRTIDPMAKQKRIMRKWGWKDGQGLGKNADGITEPVGLSGQQTDRKGLGSRPSQSKAKLKKSKEVQPIVAVIQDGDIVYGKCKGLALRVHVLDQKGIPRATDQNIHFQPLDVRAVTWWNGGVVGVSEATFPDPERWRLADIDKPLDKVGVRDLTRAFARTIAKEPNCKRKWEEIMGDVNWQAVGKRYKQGLLTPADFGTHYKCIVHRQFKLRRGEGGDSCRVCGTQKETVQHFGSCGGMKKIFQSLRTIDKGSRWNDDRMNLMGLQGRGVVKRGVSAIHMMVWKQIIPELVRADSSGEKFKCSAVLKRAARRYITREEALQMTIKLYKQKCEAVCRKPDMERFNGAIEGIAVVDEDGELRRESELEEWLRECQDEEMTD